MSLKARSIFILIYLLCVFSVVGFYTSAYSADWRVYTENGGMNVTERDVSEGHKSYHLIGLESSIENMRAKVKGGVEGWFRGEPADEDPEIPQMGAGAFAEYAYKLKWGMPYLGVRYDHIARDVPPKYENDSQFEDTLDMFSATGGVHFKYKWMWADIGTIIPFYTSTKSGNFGPDLGIGFTWKNFDVGYRFKEIRLTDHHFQGGEAFSIYWSGCEIGYSF